MLLPHNYRLIAVKLIVSRGDQDKRMLHSKLSCTVGGLGLILQEIQ